MSMSLVLKRGLGQAIKVTKRAIVSSRPPRGCVPIKPPSAQHLNYINYYLQLIGVANSHLQIPIDPPKVSNFDTRENLSTNT